MDYNQTTPVTLEFDKYNMTQCHCIPIVNDDVPESNEMFYVTLEGTADLDRDKIKLDPVNGTITIFGAELTCKQVLYLGLDTVTVVLFPVILKEVYTP